MENQRKSTTFVYRDSDPTMSFDASMMQSLQLFMNLRQQYGEDSLKRLLESTSQMPTPPTSTPDHENKQHSLEVYFVLFKANG